MQQLFFMVFVHGFVVEEYAGQLISLYGAWKQIADKPA